METPRSDPTDAPKFTCDLCGEETEGVDDAVDHIRVMHPDVYEPPERWPDGSLVVDASQAIEPKDFT